MTRTGEVTLVRCYGALPETLDALAAEADAEGYGHISRLREEWLSGRERFLADGAVLMAAYARPSEAIPALAAVGGVTCDPVVPDALRMRRFYVSPAYRRKGVGALLATALLQEALATGRPLGVHAGEDRSAAFWTSLGFAPTKHPPLTHLWPRPAQVSG